MWSVPVFDDRKQNLITSPSQMSVSKLQFPPWTRSFPSLMIAKSLRSAVFNPNYLVWIPTQTAPCCDESWYLSLNEGWVRGFLQSWSWMLDFNREFSFWTVDSLFSAFVTDVPHGVQAFSIWMLSYAEQKRAHRIFDGETDLLNVCPLLILSGTCRNDNVLGICPELSQKLTAPRHC